MKLFKYIFITAFFSVVIAACKKDEVVTTTYEYHAHIESPDNALKHLGDSLHIHVNFESHTGETIHHINVKISNKATGAVIYNKPSEAHVHAQSGEYTYEDVIVMNTANGFVVNTNYILEAKVWAETDGEQEESETVEFHVHI